jgi:hypothetical protein
MRVHLRGVAATLAAVALALAAGSCASAPRTAAPPPGARGIDVDFLFSYYDQDGEHSAVTGGTGSEAQQVLSPVVLVSWAVSEDWSLRTDLGVDQVTAASVDAIDAEVSSASRVDQRAFTDLTATRRIGERSTVSYRLGLSNEYDYQSVSAGIGYALDLNERNTTLSANLRHYEDTVKLYDIDGVNRGDDGRRTTDLAIAATQVLGRRTLGSLELDYTLQSGFLSTPFHEVILHPAGGGEVHVAERLPDSRRRAALGLGLDHAFGDRVVQKLTYRFYDDDWGIRAHTIAAETHFRLPLAAETWVFPILRYHRQTASDHFGTAGSFTGSERFFTSDWDLAEIATTKYGLGLRGTLQAGRRWRLGLRRYETRFTLFSRDDGLDGLIASVGLGWSW